MAPDRVLTLIVGGKAFTLSANLLHTHPESMLAKCFSPNPLGEGLLMRPEHDGAYLFDRNANLFQHVVLPYLQNGCIQLSPDINPFHALEELDYFGLLDQPSFVKRGITEAESTVLVRTFLGRLLCTMLPNIGGTFLFFAESIVTDPLAVTVDVAFLLTVVPSLLKSMALTEHGLCLSWRVFDGEVESCSLNKTHRCVLYNEHILAYTLLSRFDGLEVTKPCSASTPFETYTLAGSTGSTPLRYLHDAQRTELHLLTADSPTPLQITITLTYDSLHRHHSIELVAHKTGPWNTYLPLYVCAVAVPIHDSTAVFERLAGMHMQELLAHVHTQDRFHVIGPGQGMRVHDRAFYRGARGVRFPTDQYRYVALLFEGHQMSDTLTANDPASRRPKYGSTGASSNQTTRVVTASLGRTRRLCRMQVVAINPR